MPSIPSRISSELNSQAHTSYETHRPPAAGRLLPGSAQMMSFITVCFVTTESEQPAFLCVCFAARTTHSLAVQQDSNVLA
jgi:hypothetical protein